MNKLLVICGATATGKTALALSFAKKFDGELVNADSRQVYREMDIGTGKDIPEKILGDGKIEVTDEDRAYSLSPYLVGEVPLWLIDVVSPTQSFNVALYQKLARTVIADIQKRNKLPIIVGGTGLYITAITDDLDTLHIPPNPEIRQQVKNMTIQKIQQLVATEDPAAWKTMNVSDRQNPRRLIRKLEISAYNKQNPQTYSSSASEKFSLRSNNTNKKSDSLTIGLSMPLPNLYERIDARVDKRVVDGVENEVRSLVDNGYEWDLPSISGLGYREWKPYFQMQNPPAGEAGLKKEKIIQQWKFDEHAYARRQMTWFKKRPSVHWFDAEESGYEKRVESVVTAWYTGNR